MAAEVGVAYLSIVPSFKGAARELDKEWRQEESKSQKRGRSMGSKLLGGLKVGAVGAGAAVAGILTGSLAKGFKRLSAIEDAEAKLRGLGNSAEDVSKIMDNALSAVKGTAFGMDEAATTAASAVAAGIKPGKELERYLGLVGDAAQIAGTDMASMGSIFNKVATSGKVQGDVFAQLGDQGIPIVTMLAEEMGVSAEEVYKLGSAGKISSDQFLDAMSSMEGAAKEGGNTTSGAWKNMGAAMSRFGAALLEGVFPLIGPAFNKVTGFFDYLTEKAGPAVQAVSDKIKAFTASDKFQAFLAGARNVAVSLYENALKPLGEWVGKHWKTIAAVVGGIAAAFAGTAIVGAISAAGAALAGLFSTAGMVTAAIGAVVGAVTWWATSTESGKKTITAAWAFIKGAAQVLADFWTGTLWPALLDGWDVLKRVVAAVVPVIVDYARSLWSFFSQVVTGVVLPALRQFTGFITGTVWPIIQRLWTDYVQPAFTAIANLVVWAWGNVIKPAFTALSAFIRNTLAPAIVWLWKNVVSPAFTAIGKVITWVWNSVIFPALDLFKVFLTKVLAPAVLWLWKNVIVPAWNGIKTAIAVVVTWFKGTAWPVIQRVIGFIRDGFQMLRMRLAEAWMAIRVRVIQPVVSWFQGTVKPLFDRVTKAIGSAFQRMKDTVGRAWDAVKDKAKKPIRFVVDTVINKGIVSNFNKIAGKFGVAKLPTVSAGFSSGGWTGPGSKYTPAGVVHADEFVIKKSSRRQIEREAPGLLDSLNAHGAAGLRGLGYSGGGYVKQVADGIKETAGDAWDSAKKVGSFVVDALADPVKAFTGVVKPFLARIPGAGLMLDVAKKVPGKIIEGIGKKLTPAVQDSGAVVTGPMPAGASRSLSYAQQVARSFGLTMTSFRRSGARTAKGGYVSLHAQGRAMDFSNSSGPTPQMMRFFNAMHPLKPTELLYSPAGGRQWNRSGRMGDTSGATKRMHYNHVHVGFAGGGHTGAGSKYAPAGIVHADEYVIRRESQRSISRVAPGLLDALNKRGAAALRGRGYANGGRVGYASGGRVSAASKIGSVSVRSLLDGLLGTTKQVRSAAGKLANAVAAEFKKKLGGNKKAAVNRLSDQLDKLRKRSSALSRQARSSNKKTAAAAKADLATVQKQITATQDALKRARRGDTSGAGAAAGRVFFDRVAQPVTVRLEQLAKTREALTKRIKKANQKLTDAVKGRDDYAGSTASSFADGFTITAENGGAPVQWLTRQFLAATGDVKAFKSNLGKLAKLGVPAGLLDQLVQLGAVTGNRVAQNLLSAKKGDLAALGKAYTGLQKTSKSAGSSIAKSMYQTGVNAARGLVSGLKSEAKKIEAASEKLAKSMVTKVRKTLGIKSPSRVFAEIGQFTVQGMLLGLHREAGNLDRELDRLVSVGARVPSFQPMPRLNPAVSSPAVAGGDTVVHVHVGETNDGGVIGRRVAETLDLKRLAAAI